MHSRVRGLKKTENMGSLGKLWGKNHKRSCLETGKDKRTALWLKLENINLWVPPACTTVFIFLRAFYKPRCRSRKSRLISSWRLFPQPLRLKRILIMSLMLRRTEHRRRRGQQRIWWMASPIQWTRVWANSRRQWRIGEAWRAVVHGVTKSQTQLSNWTTTTSWFPEDKSKGISS